MSNDEHPEIPADAVTVLTYHGVPETHASASTKWFTFCTIEQKTIYSGDSYDDAYNAGVKHQNTAPTIGHLFKVMKG